MKLQIPILTFAIISPLFLTQCVIEEGSNTTPATDVSGSPAKSQKAYDRGFNHGLKDGRDGLSRTPGRHSGARSNESDAFDAGYEAGYNKGIR